MRMRQPNYACHAFGGIFRLRSDICGRNQQKREKACGEEGVVGWFFMAY